MPRARLSAGEPIFDRSSVHRKRASVGLLQAGEDADQCRLSGAILAEQDMDLTGEDVERDPIVCDDAGKPLRDATQFDCRAAAGGRRQRRYRLSSARRLFDHGRHSKSNGFGTAVTRRYCFASTDVISERTFCAS
jgi:hypothetical protein